MVAGSAAKNSRQKRSKYVKLQPKPDPFHLLTDDGMLFPIFEFIGPYHFRFVAGVSRRWRRLYTQFQQEELRKRVQDRLDFMTLISTTITSAASIAESVSRAKIFMDDTKTLTGRFFEAIEIQENGSQKMKDDWFSILPPKPSGYLCDHVAVQYGQLEILQLAIANGCTCNEMTSYLAAGMGQLDILRWLRENGCPWDQRVCNSAAANGHLDVLQWARETGCPWNEKTCE